jgi:hypothetical protein
VRQAESAESDLLAAVHELEHQCDRLGERPSEDALAALLETVYGLVAGGLARNYAKSSELASIIEVMLGPVAAGEEPLTGEFREILHDYIRALERLARTAPPLERRTGGWVPAVPDEVGRGSPVSLLEPDRDPAGHIAR